MRKYLKIISLIITLLIVSLLIGVFGQNTILTNNGSILKSDLKILGYDLPQPYDNLVLWLNYSNADIKSTEYLGSDYINYWRDKASASNLYPAIQSNVLLMPEKTDTGIYFDGTNDYLRINDNFELCFTDNTKDYPFSIAAQYTPISAGGAGGTSIPIIGKTQTVTTINWVLTYSITSQTFVFVLYDNISTNQIRVIGKKAILGEKINIVATYDGSQNENGIHIYYNGVLSDSINSENGTYNFMKREQSYTEIGVLFRVNSSFESYSEAVYNKILIFNKELTENEVVSLSNFMNK